MDADVEAATREPAPRRRRFWIRTCALGVAVGVTGYLGTLTVLWDLHIHELRSITADTVRLDADQKTAVDMQESEIESTRSARTEALSKVSDLADQKANTEDYRYVNHYFALSLKDCSDGQAQTLYYVKHLNRYYYSDVENYLVNVSVYCASVKLAWAQTLAEQQ